MGVTTSYETLAQIVRDASAVWHGADELWMGPQPPQATLLELPSGITFFSPEDLVISACGGIRLSEIQLETGKKGLILPLGAVPLGATDPTLAEALGLALPHVLENRYGSWREWVLGMTVVLGDGTVAKSGCRAVKSVAGYDAHKLFVGARGAFGVIAEVTLRLHPLANVPKVEMEVERPNGNSACWILRVLPSDYQRTLESAEGVAASHRDTATIWGLGSPPTCSSEHWIVSSWGAPAPHGRPNEGPWLRRAKTLLDPQDKLNPGQLEALL